MIDTTRPVRATVMAAEMIYLNLWREWNCQRVNGTLLEEILQKPKASISAREKLVTGSLIQWLGTKCGAVFLDKAKKLLGFEQTWQEENIRRRWVCSGITTLEWILSDEEIPTFLSESDRTRIIENTTDEDRGVALKVILWLATPWASSLSVRQKQESKELPQFTKIFSTANGTWD